MVRPLDLDEQDMIRWAVEALGGLEYLQQAPMSVCKDKGGQELPTCWEVSICVYCYEPVWKSSRPAEENCWNAAWYLDQCYECAHKLETMAPDVKAMFSAMAKAQLRLHVLAHHNRTVWDRL